MSTLEQDVEDIRVQGRGGGVLVNMITTVEILSGSKGHSL